MSRSGISYKRNNWNDVLFASQINSFAESNRQLKLNPLFLLDFLINLLLRKACANEPKLLFNKHFSS